MTPTTASFESLTSIVNESISVIDLLQSIQHGEDKALDDYKTLCSKIPEHIDSGLIRIAVVGVIKSGKSTYINAMARKELVKRGAGVVTAVTTRIRRGKKNRARIRLKSWDEINNTVEKALEMFPEKKPEAAFDIRRKKDRAYLRTVYDTLTKDFPVTREGIRPEPLLIRNALDGFDLCNDVVEADEREICFESKSFEKHKAYTADPSRAFYVKDVCLELFGKAIDANVEIADCQGADSTDPSQLAQIISYIESANLIVYCISSRTGLRQSDMVFLKTIKRLGLLENILFINNCDLTEHENLADLKQIREKIRRDLQMVTPTPPLYTFSALYNLFDALGSRLSKRNAKRLDLWNDDPSMIKFCAGETERFSATYSRLLAKHRFDLLHANHIERLRIVMQSLDRKAKLISDVLATDLDDQEKSKERLSELEGNARRLRVIVDNSVQGAVSGLANEINANLKSAFLKDSVNINRQVTRFVNDAVIDIEPYRAGVKETGFKQIIYLMFQDFKRQLDVFTLEQVVPELKHLVSAQEERIEAYFQALLDSYRIDFFAMGHTPGEEEGTGNLPKSPERESAPVKAVNINTIKKILGLRLPDQVVTPRFTKRMRANALTDFGLHSVVLFISALVDKHVRFSFTPGLNKASDKIKKESLRLVRMQIKGYHLTLKNDYFAPLIQAATRDFKEKILERFSLYEALNKDMERLFKLRQEEKQARREQISTARENIDGIIRDLDAFFPVDDPYFHKNY